MLSPRGCWGSDVRDCGAGGATLSPPACWRTDDTGAGEASSALRGYSGIYVHGADVGNLFPRGCWGTDGCDCDCDCDVEKVYCAAAPVAHHRLVSHS